MTTPKAPWPAAAADRPVRWKTALVLAALGPVGYGLLRLAMAFPEITERGYARGLYPYVQRTLAAAVSWSAVPVGEVLLLVSVGLCVVRPVRGLWGLLQRRRRLTNLLGHALAQSLAAAGLLLFLFVMLWGLNHARLPVAGRLGLTPRPADAAALVRVAERLAERAAAARPAEFGDAPFLPADWRNTIGDAYDAAGAQWPELAGPRPSIRSAWLSHLLTLASITGIYSPFTGEPNVNGEIPPVLLPAVACHEVAHLRGFAREDEANFLAWWVGSRSPDRALAYSCELFAWRVVMGELWGAKLGEWQRLRRQAPPALLADDAAIRAFWDRQPKGATKVLTTIATATNDTYLKGSGHRAGVRSYGAMVDLLIAALDR